MHCCFMERLCNYTHSEKQLVSQQQRQQIVMSNPQWLVRLHMPVLNSSMHCDMRHRWWKLTCTTVPNVSTNTASEVACIKELFV